MLPFRIAVTAALVLIAGLTAGADAQTTCVPSLAGTTTCSGPNSTVYVPLPPVQIAPLPQPSVGYPPPVQVMPYGAPYGGRSVTCVPGPAATTCY